MSRDSFKTVYSTEKSMCRKCGRVVCICGEKRPKPQGQVRIGRETKGRKGAGVTVITGLAMSEAELKERPSTNGADVVKTFKTKRLKKLPPASAIFLSPDLSKILLLKKTTTIAQKEILYTLY